MKKLTKITFKNPSGLMSEEEMRMIFGGYGSEGSEDLDSYAKDPNPKITACKSMKDKDPCSYKDDRGVTQYGRCVAFPPSYTFICSDLK